MKLRNLFKWFRKDLKPAAKKFEDKLSVTWPCRRCDTIIWISEHYVSDPCPGCGWIWKGRYDSKIHNIVGKLVKKMKQKYAHDAYDHAGDKL